MPLHCPLCRSTYVRRARRAGALEHLLSLFYVYPFRCQLCSARFMNLQWGVRYSKQEDLHQYERIGVRFPVLFTNAQIIGTGVVTDVSVAGCAIETALPLKPGNTLKLELYVKNGLPPIIVSQAVIRSVLHGTAGVQFVEMADSEHTRLNHVVGGMVGVPVAPVPDSRASASPAASFEETR